MNKIPISLMFMTSTKGHFGHRDVWLSTLNHLARQVPLDTFRTKIAHIKISPEHLGAISGEMTDRLEHLGFKVLTTVAAWSRGTSHQIGYNEDLITVSKVRELHDSPHILWLEDDNTMTCHQASLLDVLASMVELVESSPDTLSARFIRAADFAGGVPILARDGNIFVSPYFDFQPLIMRTRDFYQAAKIIESFPELQGSMQIEALWRTALGGFSRSEHKHLVWLPEYAESIHLGVPNYLDIKASLGL